MYTSMFIDCPNNEMRLKVVGGYTTQDDKTMTFALTLEQPNEELTIYLRGIVPLRKFYEDLGEMVDKIYTDVSKLK